MQELIKHFGNKRRMAIALGVDAAAVAWWARNGLPALRAIQIERITKGKFKAVDIEGKKGDD